MLFLFVQKGGDIKINGGFGVSKMESNNSWTASAMQTTTILKAGNRMTVRIPSQPFSNYLNVISVSAIDTPLYKLIIKKNDKEEIILLILSHHIILFYWHLPYFSRNSLFFLVFFNGNENCITSSDILKSIFIIFKQILISKFTKWLKALVSFCTLYFFISLYNIILSFPHLSSFSPVNRNMFLVKIGEPGWWSFPVFSLQNNLFFYCCYCTDWDQMSFQIIFITICHILLPLTLEIF